MGQASTVMRLIFATVYCSSSIFAQLYNCLHVRQTFTVCEAVQIHEPFTSTWLHLRCDVGPDEGEY